MVEETNVVTRFIYPPIPNRAFDWQAMTKRDADNYCGCGECGYTVGYGETEAAAIQDLKEQLEERS